MEKRTIAPDETYNGVAIDARWADSQTTGIRVSIRVEDDRELTTFFTVWVTAKNRDNAERDLKTLGVDPKMLRDAEYLSGPIFDTIRGRKFRFNTKREEYPKGSGKFDTKVSGIRPHGLPASTLAKQAAALFAQAPPVATSFADAVDSDPGPESWGAPPEDDEIAFGG